MCNLASRIRGIGLLLLVGIGITAAGIYAGWWRETALEILQVVGVLLQTSLLGWMEADGLRKYCLFGGAFTVLWVLLRFGIPAALAFIRDTLDDPVALVAGVVVLGCIPIAVIPLIAGGWPVVLWYWYGDRSENRRESAVPGPQ